MRMEGSQLRARANAGEVRIDASQLLLLMLFSVCHGPSSVAGFFLGGVRDNVGLSSLVEKTWCALYSKMLLFRLGRG